MATPVTGKLKDAGFLGGAPAAAKNQEGRSGEYRDLVQALRTLVADLHLSARPAFALQSLNIRKVYELVQQSPMGLFALPNLGHKSLKEIKDKLATLGLTLGMGVDDDSDRAAIVATVAANLRPGEG